MLRIPFFIYPIIGMVLGLGFLFLPRWEFLDKYYIGLGLLIPVVLCFLLVGAVLFYVDAADWHYKFMKLALMAVADIGAVAYLVSTIKIGF